MGCWFKHVVVLCLPSVRLPRLGAQLTVRATVLAVVFRWVIGRG